ncbi:MAG TPA: glycosyltransferase [Desulfobulbaceae bacterium]|nr:glycosyltransferase [Desulfobulbaceae bacterium]
MIGDSEYGQAGSGKTRLAIIVSHPIQHFVPFYRALAKVDEIDLTVIYASKIGLSAYFDKDMNEEISWNMDLLSGYNYIFLEEAERIKKTSPLDINNPSVGSRLDEVKPDIVLIYGYNQVTSLRGVRWCRRNEVPAIMISDSELKGVRSRKVRMLKSIIVPAILNKFKAFLTVGDCNEEYYRHYGVQDEKLFRSPFTIDEDVYRKIQLNRQKVRAEERKTIGVSDRDIVILTVGKINDRKRSSDIIEAAKLLESDKTFQFSIKFVVAGNGNKMEELREEAKKMELPVKFLGFINVDRLPDIYAAADIILHPSSKDPHPLVMSEAACVGLPLVVSDRVGAVGVADIARPGENTLVFPCGDVPALAKAIKRLAEDDKLREHMGARSVEIFNELDMRRSVKGLLEAVDFCLKHDNRK